MEFSSPSVTIFSLPLIVVYLTIFRFWPETWEVVLHAHSSQKRSAIKCNS